MREDPFLTGITVVVSLGCLLLVAILATTGAFDQTAPLVLSVGLVAAVSGLWAGLVRLPLRERRNDRHSLLAIEELVGRLPGPRAD